MRKGFTLVETMIATSLMTATVVVAVGSLVLFIQKSGKVNNQAILDMDARKVVERFRQEVRNAARETIIFYPKNSKPYTGMAFALAEDKDNDGLMDMDASGTNILWRKSVVYHVCNKKETPQMRRTVFENRNNSAGEDDYYTQLEKVVLTGSGESACLSGERAKTSVMFENLFSGKLWDTEANFDCYAPKPNTLERVTFGSISLGPGQHTMEMIITGKHPKSTGRNLRLDQLSVGVCGWPLEAELRTTGGATATTLFTGPNLSGAAYVLNAATAADNDKLSLTLYNDAIEEAEFIGLGRNVSLSNTVVRFDENFYPSGHAQGSYATLLDGQFAESWRAAEQSDGRRDLYLNATNCIMRIPIMPAWVKVHGYGPVFRMYKSYYNNGTNIKWPMFENLTTGEIYPLEFYQNGVKLAGWQAVEKMSFADLRPANTVKLDEQSELVLSFEVEINNYGSDRFTGFSMKRPGLPGCYMLIEKKPSAIAETTPLYLRDEQTLSNNYEVVRLDMLPVVESMAVNYADKGEYISHVYDTRSSKGASKKIEWDADVPSGTTLTIFTRSGNRISDTGFDITDAPTWESAAISANGGSINGTGRYVQFRAEVAGQPSSTPPGVTGSILQGPYRSDTPRLHHVLITWDGEEKYVEIVANLLKNPDCGMFRVEIDGKPMIRGVNMEIEIFKDIRTMGGAKERIKSTIMAEVEPRNNQKNQN